MSEKENNLVDEKYRVIKIGREALFEFIYESFIDNQKSFYDIKDITAVSSHFSINWETGEFICLIHNSENDKGEIIKIPSEIDLQKLIENMNDTTETLYASDRYLEYTLEDIISIQTNGDSNKTK